MLKISWLLIFGIFIASDALTQSIYFYTDGPPYPGGYWKVDVNTCEVCPVFDPAVFPNVNTNDNTNAGLILPNGDILAMRSVGGFGPFGGMYRFDPPNPNPIATIGLSTVFEGGFVHPNGTVYVNSSSGLYTFNSATNTVTLVGNFPSGWAVESTFFQNGVAYALVNPSGGIFSIAQINLTNPSASTIVGNTSVGISHVTTAANGQSYVYHYFNNGNPIGFHTLDATTGALTPVCVPPVPPPYIFAGGSVRTMMAAPAGTPDLPCLCLGVAGSPNINSINLCVPQVASLGFSAAQLDFNDIVRYILYTNPANPLGSIVQNNPTPSFNFGPPLQENVPYYVAQVVGNQLNGDINLADPCLDLSNATTVTWRPRPEVTNLSVLEPTLCAGECQSVSLSLSGTPPFAYSWQIQQNGTLITPLQVAFGANSNPISFQACVPPNAPPGQFSVVICAISDAFCGNQ
jgi:hypothetical protein